MDNNFKITVVREKQFFVGNPGIDFYIDDVKVGCIKSGETFEAFCSPGHHRIMFKLSFRESVFDVDVIADASVALRLSRGSGEIKAVICGVAEAPPSEDWKLSPRDSTMVYPDARKTSPFVSLILSIVIVGLGQMVNGQFIKGLLVLVGSMVVSAITGGIAAPFLWVIFGIDAYMSVSKLKKGQPIGRFSFF